MALGDAGITSAQNSAGAYGYHTGHSLWLALKVDVKSIGEVLPARMAVRTLQTQHEVGEISVPDRTAQEQACSQLTGIQVPSTQATEHNKSLGQRWVER